MGHPAARTARAAPLRRRRTRSAGGQVRSARPGEDVARDRDNPGLEELVLELAGDALDRVRTKFPTSAIAVLAWRGSTWDSLAPGTALLTDVTVPRGTKKQGQGESTHVDPGAALWVGLGAA
ncbi:hypothetical protein GCM10022206_14000 [Streptomyces chiangmaiensis]